MKGALDGVRVLELGNFISGPYAAVLLADMGAEVVKVENPKGGDPFRGWDLGGDQPNFWAYNRGKKSVTLNLQAAEGRELFYGLCKKADVVLENYRPGVTKKLAIDYESLKPLNERLIYCSITGMGATGPYAHRPAYDTVGQGLGGMLSLLMDRENPRPIGPAFADCLGGVFGAMAVLGALCARAKTGRGQYVETSMAGAVLAFLTAPATEYLATGKIPGPTSRPRNSQTYAFAAADGRLLAIHLSSPPKFWEGLTEVAGRADLREDPRFKDRHARIRNYDELAEILKEIFRTKPRDHWLKGLLEHDVPCAPIHRLDEVFEDPQVRHLDRLVTIRDPELGAFQLVKNGANLLGTPIDVALSPPKLGEHSEEILKHTGYSAEQIRDFRGKGII